MADKSANRKMSAILSADVKGYSRLMSMDEEGTVKAHQTAVSFNTGAQNSAHLPIGAFICHMASPVLSFETRRTLKLNGVRGLRYQRSGSARLHK